jgi:hypothetical protein
MVGSLIDGAVTDAQMARVLGVFVHGTRPVLGALRAPEPRGSRRVLASARGRVLDWVSTRRVPGTSAWATMGVEQRTDWWVNRVGRFTALLAAVPGLAGALADRLPVQDALGAAGQGLLLCALAGEHGIRDEDSQVRLLASVLFGRDVDAALGHGPDSSSPDGSSSDGSSSDPRSAELTTELATSQRKHGRFTLPAIAAAVWRMGRLLWGLGDELGKRPRGRWYHKLIGMLPLAGMAGDYLGERAALRRVARAGRRWIVQHQTVRS